ncbi:MAG: vWA domain-containing protein [Candidatus Zixiibacteriota bacterium]
MKRSLVILVAILMALLMLVASCDNNKFALLRQSDKTPNDNINHDDDGGTGNVRGCAPRDPGGQRFPDLVLNNAQPSGNFSCVDGTSRCVQINMPGIIDPVTGEPLVLKQGKNIFIEEDGKPQGFNLFKVEAGDVLQVDLVFTVDNSGSMGGESDAIAAGIVAFAQLLEAGGLDVRFASVGNDHGGVNGALNFSTAERLEQYLNFRNGSSVSGTSRTVGYEGADSAALNALATSDFHAPVGGENGVVMVLFADSAFDWRPGAQRQYINFTDEPTQPGGQPDFATQTMCDKIGGTSTVHTVWSGSSDTTGFNRDPLEDEAPWDMSTCSGGLVSIINSSGSNLDLTTLPVVGSLTSSYRITFESANRNVPHSIRILVKDENVDGETILTEVRYCP